MYVCMYVCVCVWWTGASIQMLAASAGLVTNPIKIMRYTPRH